MRRRVRALEKTSPKAELETILKGKRHMRNAHKGEEKGAGGVEKGGDEKGEGEDECVYEEGGGEQGNTTIHTVAEQSADDDKGILQVTEDLRLL